MHWFVYIAETITGYFYTGISKDVEKRLIAHNTGRGAKFARMHGGMKLVYKSPPLSRSAALKKEAELKKLSHAQKKEIISGE